MPAGEVHYITFEDYAALHPAINADNKASVLLIVKGHPDTPFMFPDTEVQVEPVELDTITNGQKKAMFAGPLKIKKKAGCDIVVMRKRNDGMTVKEEREVDEFIEMLESP